MKTRRRKLTLLTALFVVMSLGFACGQPQRVGSERLTEFEEQEINPRLGERAGEEEEEDLALGTPAPLGVGDRATPPPPPTPVPTPEERFFEVALIAESPYYHPGNRLVIGAGTILRVTNTDRTAERPQRSFTDQAGTFGSGPLSPGESWTHRFTTPASYNIVDEGLPFATATLEVR